MPTMTYAQQERDRAIAWKRSAHCLPTAARGDGTYVVRGHETGPHRFCLPKDQASLNLLPDVREKALSTFRELGISWHAGIDGGPSNHLLDSQVQCANALTAMVDDPERIARAFGDVVDLSEVLPIEASRHLTFEYIGPSDYFDEGRGRPRLRGKYSTSVDAAFLYLTSDRRRELALVEWKYTESYPRPRVNDPARDRTRIQRYGKDYLDPDGPLRSHLMPLDWMLDEPFYQLMRQQLLAHKLENDAGLGLDAVRVLHVLSPENEAYQRSLPRPEHRALGATVDEAWAQLLKRPDRFLHVDPVGFVRPGVTNREYVERYGA